MSVACQEHLHHTVIQASCRGEIPEPSTTALQHHSDGQAESRKRNDPGDISLCALASSEAYTRLPSQCSLFHSRLTSLCVSYSLSASLVGSYGPRSKLPPSADRGMPTPPQFYQSRLLAINVRCKTETIEHQTGLNVEFGRSARCWAQFRDI